MHLGTHLVSRYAHMHRALVTLEQLRWRRIPVGAGGQEGAHPHAFFRDGEDKRFTRVEVRVCVCVRGGGARADVLGCCGCAADRRDGGEGPDCRQGHVGDHGLARCVRVAVSGWGEC